MNNEIVNDKIKITQSKNFTEAEILKLYDLNKWSSTKKPDLLIKALKNSDTVVLARYQGQLIGMGPLATLNLLYNTVFSVIWNHMSVIIKLHRYGEI